MEEFKGDDSLLSQVMSKSKVSDDVPKVSQLADYDYAKYQAGSKYQSGVDLNLPEYEQAFMGRHPNSDGRQGGSGDYYRNLASVVSGGKWDAYNKGSGAYGKFQFIPSTEKAYAKKLGISIDQARTPRGQMAMASAFTNDNKRGLIKAGFTPTQQNLYLAHQQGLGGALTMLRGGQASDINLRSNGVSNTSQWFDKFGGRFG